MCEQLLQLCRACDRYTVVKISRRLYLELNKDNIMEILDFQGEELWPTKDLIELENQMMQDNESTASPEEKHFTAKGWTEGISLLDQAVSRFEA